MQQQPSAEPLHPSCRRGWRAQLVGVADALRSCKARHIAAPTGWRRLDAFHRRGRRVRRSGMGRRVRMNERAESEQSWEPLESNDERARTGWPASQKLRPTRCCLMPPPPSKRGETSVPSSSAETARTLRTRRHRRRRDRRMQWRWRSSRERSSRGCEDGEMCTRQRPFLRAAALHGPWAWPTPSEQRPSLPIPRWRHAPGAEHV